MEKHSKRGYFIKENAPIYYTKDMDKTLQWFQEILGWYGRIIDRNGDGIGVYGFVSDTPQDQQAVPFQGIHLWYGEPILKTLALIQVQGIHSLCSYAKQNGWNQMSDIHETGASPETCDITTLDGSTLMFFE